jgi:hypothetical protein
MPIKAKYSHKLRKKYHIPDYFQDKDEETEFWQNFNSEKKMTMVMDLMTEHFIKKYGSIPRMERVITIRKRKQIKS